MQTPTLAMLVEREQRIAVFQKEKSYTVQLLFDGYEAQSAPVSGREEAEKMLKACENAQAFVVSTQIEEKTVNPPRLYDLTSLQREANRIYGYTAQQTLDIAQKLYEMKYLTYPRTDSRYITQDMAQSALEIVKAACALFGFVNFEPDVTRMADDKKVNDHHALLPTMQGIRQELGGLPQSGRDIFTLVAKRAAIASASPCRIKQQTVNLNCSDIVFTVKGKVVTQAGFTALEIMPDKEGDSLSVLPELVRGQGLSPVDKRVCEHESTPPKPYTEDTLLSAMERAGNSDLDPLLETEKSGLGTPATRAGFIEKLIKSGYAIRKGKQLLPADKGMQLISIVPEALRSPRMTAQWENELSRIAAGDGSGDAFMQSIEGFVRQLVSEGVKSTMDAALFREKQESIGLCLRCGKNVVERAKGFCCEDRGCGFAMWKNDLFFKSKKKTLTKAAAASLLKTGKAAMTGLYSQKTEKKYDATILLDDTGGQYVRYKLEFDS